MTGPNLEQLNKVCSHCLSCLFCQYKIKYMKSFFIGNIEIKTPVIQGGMGVGISLSVWLRQLQMKEE